MVKLSDFTKLTDKLDVAGMLKNVKSMVNPDSAAAVEVANTSSASDPLTQKIAELAQAVQDLATTNKTQNEVIAKMSKTLAALNQEIGALKKTSAQAADPSAPSVSPEQSTTSKSDSDNNITT